MTTEIIQSLYADVETVFETDPSSDGSGYLFAAHNAVLHYDNKREQLATDYQAESGLRTLPRRGASGWDVEVSIPVRGLSVSPDDGASPSVTDVDDLFLTNAWGSTSDRDGEGVSTSSTGTSLILDASGNAVDYDLIPIYESGLTTPDRTQWAMVTDDSSDPTLTIAPDLTISGAAPTTAAVARGCRMYRFSAATQSIALYGRHGSHYYTLLGGKVIRMRTTVNNRGIAMNTFNVQGSSWSRSGTAKSSIPAPTPPTHGGCVAVRGGFWFNGAAYSISSTSIEWGLDAKLRLGQDGANGYVAGRNINMRPTIQIDPLYSTTLEDAFDDPEGNNGLLLYQIGGGVLSGTRLNTVCVVMNTAWVNAHTQQGRNGERGSQVTLEAAEVTNGATQFQYARA